MTLAAPASIEAIGAAVRALEHDRATSIGHDEGAFIVSLLRERGLTRTIEIGFAYGVSAAYILAATGAAHVAIDPQPEAYDNLGMRNLEVLGVADRCRLERDVAHNVLPRFAAAGRRFEFAFVDGDHKFDTTFVEFYYLDLVLDAGGYILFHDAWMPSIQHVASWIRHNKANYEMVDTPLKNLILVRKVGDDHRPWHHFADFALRRPFWSALKRGARALAERTTAP